MGPLWLVKFMKISLFCLWTFMFCLWLFIDIFWLGYWTRCIPVYRIGISNYKLNLGPVDRDGGGGDYAIGWSSSFKTLCERGNTQTLTYLRTDFMLERGNTQTLTYPRTDFMRERGNTQTVTYLRTDFMRERGNTQTLTYLRTDFISK